MSDKLDPAVVAREAKGIHQSLKELLKTKEPFDKEVDFQRKNLRRRYLILLLVFPNAKESKDVENHLWMQTSYASIASFKQRIATDRMAQNNQRQQNSGPASKQNPHHGIVEHRKLVQRFKQFLADEERFWRQFILRFFRLFDLHEARAALITLSLLDEAGEGTTSTGDGIDANGRNHFQFPPRDPSVDSSPKTTEEREARISTLSKALICLGDIARYRELYNESNGRPRAGQDDNIPARRGRNKRGGPPDTVARPRDYDKAQQCYEQARLLVPHEGNPSHQLAILASYQKDSFSSITHYYRSLCVRQPYDTASENLGTVLMKSLDLWRQKEKVKVGTNDAEVSIRTRVDLLRERIVILHALWRVGMEKGIERMRSISPKHNEKVAQDFSFLVADRHLPIDMISNIIVLTQGALWKHRMIRDSHQQRNKGDSTSDSSHLAVLIEWSILDHILDLYRILLDVGKAELAEPSEESDLALKISATFRRTLPALRIASKWLRANIRYLGQDHEFIAFQAKEQSKNSTVIKKHPSKISGYSIKTIRFWKSYASFVLALSQAFPIEKLPSFEAPLEEDIEMRGFLPLRNLIGEGRKIGDKSFEGGAAREQVHPNVEQLMRIWDLLEDAKSLCEVENPPVQLINTHFLFNSGIVEDISFSSSRQVVEETTAPRHSVANIDTYLDTTPDHDADEVTVGRLDDDPVRDAFQFLNAADTVEDVDEEDEIVYMRSPTLSPKPNQAPMTPVRPAHSPETQSPQSPTFFGNTSLLQQTNSVTTAQDLLNDVMRIGGLNSTRRSVGGVDNPSQGSSAPQATFLFGSELSRGTSQSIWSASRDEQPLIYPGNGATTSPGSNGNSHYPGMNGSQNFVGGVNFLNGLNLGGNYQTTTTTGQNYQLSFSASADSHDFPLSRQSFWSTSYGDPTTLPNRTMPFSAPFSQSPQAVVSTIPQSRLIPQHRLEQSISGASYPPQIYPNHIQQDPFAYSSPVLHQLTTQDPDPQMSTHSGTSVGHSRPQSFGQSAAVTTMPIEVGQAFYNRAAPAYHSRQATKQNVLPELFVSPNVSQTWDNGG